MCITSGKFTKFYKLSLCSVEVNKTNSSRTCQEGNFFPHKTEKYNLTPFVSEIQKISFTNLSVTKPSSFVFLYRLNKRKKKSHLYMMSSSDCEGQMLCCCSARSLLYSLHLLCLFIPTQLGLKGQNGAAVNHLHTIYHVSTLYIKT